jgi:hypothetical protein
MQSLLAILFIRDTFHRDTFVHAQLFMIFSWMEDLGDGIFYSCILSPYCDNVTTKS